MITIHQRKATYNGLVEWFTTDGQIGCTATTRFPIEGLLMEPVEIVLTGLKSR